MDKSSVEWCGLNLSHVEVLQRLEIGAFATGLSAVHVAVSLSLSKENMWKQSVDLLNII